MKIGAVYCIYDDHEYLEASLEAVKDIADKVLFLISDIPWNGEASDNKETINRVKELCEKNNNFELIQGYWGNEADQRNFGLNKLYKEEIEYCLIIDADEIYHLEHLKNLVLFAEQNRNIYAFHIEWNTYWKKSYYKIHPREEFKPVVLVKISNFSFTSMRNGTTGVIRNSSGIFNFEEPYKGVLIPSNIAICYHLSYARSDENIKRKIETFSHAKEINASWYDNVWLNWKEGDKNLHPINAYQYSTAIKDDYSQFPLAMKRLIRKEPRLTSVIILNWNCRELTERCVGMVKGTITSVCEIIVVDNGSSEEGTKETLEKLGVKVIYNKENLGFAGGVNVGIRAASKESNICLMNADAEPQWLWLEEMYNTVRANPNAGIIGSLGNQVASGWQRVGLFKEDTVVPNLMGYCMLIMREVIDKIGLFDERYKIGCYEDNDIGMRAMMAGYQLMISAKSLVIHKAHQVSDKNKFDISEQEKINKDVFMNKIYGIAMVLAQNTDIFKHEEVSKQLGIKID